MDDHSAHREGGGSTNQAQKPPWFRFSLKALLVIVTLLSVAIVAYQFGYQMGRTVKILTLIDEGWIPPKPPKK